MELYFILDNIRSRFNVGSIFRTADALAVTRLYLCGITPMPTHQEIHKAALGAEETVAWEKSWELGVVFAELRARGVKIFAAEKADMSTDMREIQWPDRVALVLGPEREGHSKRISELCDATVHIPMFGSKTSLNVAVAAGVLGYWVQLARKNFQATPGGIEPPFSG